MEQIILFFTIFVIIIAGFLIYEKNNNEVSMVTSSLDNRKYLVQKNDDSQEAANLISDIRIRLEKLVNYCARKYPNSPAIARMVRKFNPNNISEVGKNSKYTSYSVNKGEKLVLCLRSRDGKNKLIDDNTLMFVATHELGHIMTESVGHTDEFWKNFKFLLEQALSQGLYIKVDYSKDPKPYCGIKVTDTPLNM